MFMFMGIVDWDDDKDLIWPAQWKYLFRFKSYELGLNQQ